MTDSLFDNRYRYDYIYPRGRSGETLRALDIQQNDRLVVVKRPAPNDAPPIRAGQEVSILNERRALTRLAGHPVLTELLGDGQFTVGGVTHQYIVMERASGVVISDEVLALSQHGERLPELEMLVIVERLLDLLQTAHARDIVYNDVDAKHLFWDRGNYRLKVIDWGNTVFLEGDEITPQGISRQSDIYQTGELLYFILTGGSRLDVPRNAGDDFTVDFGEDGEHVSPQLQAIISKAVHPNPRQRYSFVNELRRDLAEYRQPLERERDGTIARIVERLKRNLSKTELNNLLNTLDSVIALDPGYPPAHQVRAEITEKLQDLNITADLDAVRIYMEGGNWSKAVEVLNDMRAKAGPTTAAKVNLLLDYAILLLDSPLANTSADATPPAVLDAISLIFDDAPAEAAHTLLMMDSPDGEIRKLQWLLAERISSHVPEVLLLRPNLYRLELALAILAGEGFALAEARTLLNEIRSGLNEATRIASLALLRDKYRVGVDRLTSLNALLSTFAVQHNLSNRKLPLSSLERALNATMALADNMHVIGKQATASPRDALSALDVSRTIDPTNSVWDEIARLLNHLYELLQSYQTYVPAADGSDLELWLKTAQVDLQPFTQNLFDEMLTGMVGGLKVAEEAWNGYDSATVQGDRLGAVTALTRAIDAVSTISPTLAGWLNQLRSVVEGAQYIERHTLYGGLGRTLADGWEAFDRSRLGDAERLGTHAFEIARNESEKFAARRLRDFAKITRDWVERNGVGSAKRTESALTAIEALYTPEENRIRESFTTQMPSYETYLKAMGKGIVELYNRVSSAAPRLLAVDYLMRATLAVHTVELEDAQFWREAAMRVLGENGTRHIITRTLDDFTERRRDINRIAALTNQLNNPQALEMLEKNRRLIEENPQVKTVSPVVLSLREFEIALRDWAEGEFRSAGLKLENALKAIDEVQQTAEIHAPDYRAWLMQLQAGAAELHTQMRQMRQTIENRPSAPDEGVRQAHHRIAQVSQQLVGDKYAATLVLWRDTYERFLAVYVDRTIRRSAKLERFNELFRAMFIDRHPAYSLYRHWYDVTDQAPEFPAPPTNEPTPRLDESTFDPISEFAGSRYIDPEAPPRRGGRTWLVVVGIVIVLGVLAAIAFVTTRPGGDGTDASAVVSAATEAETEEPTPETAATRTTPTPAEPSPAATEDTSASNSDLSAADLATSTPARRITATSAATATPDVPTATPTITATPTATVTDPPTITPTATLPEGGIQGQQDLLGLIGQLQPDDLLWTAEQFSPQGDGSWRLGIGGDTAEEQIRVGFAPETLETVYGSAPLRRIRRLEATMRLITANPELVAEQVYFGVGLVDPEDEMLTGVQMQVADLNAGTVNIQSVNGEAVEVIASPTVNNIGGRLRLDRDLNTGAVTLFFNDAQVGQTITLEAPDAPLLPVLFVYDGGVIVSVTDWRVTLR